MVGDDQVLQLRQVVPHLIDLRLQFRRCHQDDGAAVLQSIADRVRPERREERPDDAARLQRAEHGGVQLRCPVHEDEDPRALLHAELLEHVGELVGQPRHIGVGVRFAVAVLALPEDARLFAVAGRDVPVERLVGDVEAAARQAVQLIDDPLVVERRARALVVVQVRADGELVCARLGN